VHGVGRAFLAGQQRRAGAGRDERLVLFHRHIGDAERDRRIGQVEDSVDALGFIPAPGDGHADVGLVLMIGGDDLHHLAGGLAAVILHRQFRGDDRADALIIGEGRRLVVEHAELDRVLRESRRRDDRGHDRAGDNSQRLA
jgi:hypothetical protein